MIVNSELSRYYELFTHYAIVPSELVLGDEADMQLVFLQKDVISGEKATDVKLTILVCQVNPCII